MIGKHSKHRRPLNSSLDYRGDGQFPKERIKGKDKHYLKRWTRRREQEEFKKALENYVSLV
jgi:hypothetical protein